MKSLSTIVKATVAIMLLTVSFKALAQDSQIQYWRPWDQRGINVFEVKKNVENPEFDGLKVRIGGAFAEEYQALKHENKANVKLAADGKTDLNKLYSLGSGFNLASANLNFDVQLEDGIRLTLENYMSSRHHEEFWVKGGYVQVDKLPMFGNPEWFTKYVRVKLGQFGINYGDQQFRRSDGGNAMYNPFSDNYIMDAFATEVAGEFYIFPTDKLMGMVAVSDGLLNGNVADVTKKPSIYAKLAYDNQVNEDFRVRVSASIYGNKNSASNTLYGGDRTGSRYFLVMEPAYFIPRGTTTLTAANSVDLPTSGRINPGFRTNIMTWQIAPFIKFKGLELSATYEKAQGYASSDPKDEKGNNITRKVDQVAVDGVYRFLKNEQVYIGARYNTLTGKIDPRISNDLTIDRYEISAGWFPTRNLLLKTTYVNQEYKDYPSASIYSQGKFHGVLVEAVLAF